MEDARKAAAGAADSATKSTVDKVSTATSGLAANLGSALDHSFSTDSLKAAVGSLGGDKLKDLAEKLFGAIGEKQGMVQALKDQIAGLSGADAVAKGAGLAKSLESATGLLAGLRAKLAVVVDKLKANGIDVSKYLAVLGEK
jgi:hypothetical protein